MKLDDAVYAPLCETLRQESVEQVERIGAALLEIERGASGAQRQALLDDAFRQAHNLKGASASA